MKPGLLIILLLFLTSPALACPFCEYGATDVAYFIISVFGLFAISGIFLLVYFWRMGSFSANDRTALKVLEAEGIEQQEGEQSEQSK